MKFTKEEAVEKLNQMLTNGGKKPLRMSTKTLNEHTENLMSLVADEEMELDDFIAKVKPMLENVNSNMEKDRSDFIKEYEKNHPKPEPKPGEPKPGEPKPGNEPDKSQLDKLQEQIDQLVAQRDREAEERAVADKRAEIRKYLTDNNVKDEKWLDSFFAVVSIGKDDDVEEKGKSFLELYNKSKAGDEPLTPGTPSTGGGNDPKDMFAAVRALRKDPEDVSK